MMAHRPHPRRRRLVVLLAAVVTTTTTLVAARIIVACTSFEAGPGQADAEFDSGPSSSGDAPSDTKPPAPACPTRGCPTPTTNDAGTCDGFERETPATAGWGLSGDPSEVIIEDGGCSGGVLSIRMPPRPVDGGSGIKMLSRNDTAKVLNAAVVDFDLWLDVDITAFTSVNAEVKIVSIGNGGTIPEGGRTAGISVRRMAGVVAFIATGVSRSSSINISPRTWTHVRLIVMFGKNKTGRFAVYLDEVPAFDDVSIDTLPDAAIEAPGFSTSIGILSQAGSPEVRVKFDNFVATYDAK